MNRRTRLSLSIGALCCALIAGSAACGDDEPAKAGGSTTTSTMASTTSSAEATSTTSTSTTTVEGGGTTPAAPPTSGDEAPTPTVAFAQGVQQLRTAIDDAGSDLCALTKVFDAGFQVEDPTTADQTREAVDVVTAFFLAIADAAPPAQASAAAKIRTGVDKLRADAAAANYDPASLANGLGQDLSDGLTGVMGAARQQCG